MRTSFLAVFLGVSRSTGFGTHYPRRAVTLRWGVSNEEDSGDNFMASLRSRVEALADRETKLPVLVLDSMLPRQVLRLEVKRVVVDPT